MGINVDSLVVEVEQGSQRFLDASRRRALVSISFVVLYAEIKVHYRYPDNRYSLDCCQDGTSL